MPKYEIIMYWSQEDQGFIAEVPELPGCAADGGTYQQALANVEVVIQEWLETAKELDGISLNPKEGWYLPKFWVLIYKKLARSPPPSICRTMLK